MLKSEKIIADLLEIAITSNLDENNLEKLFHILNDKFIKDITTKNYYKLKNIQLKNIQLKKFEKIYNKLRTANSFRRRD